MSLFVVYVPETGHVVGAVNTNGGAPPEDVSSLVGDALPMRVALGTGDIATILLPAGDLELHAPDDEPGVLTDPLAYAVEFEGTTPQPTLARLSPPPWTDGLDFVDSHLKVTVPVAGSEITRVLGWVSDGEDTQAAVANIAAGSTETTLQVTVSDGPHAVLVLAAGWVGRLEEVSAP
jgi:hypothetical protein